MIDLIKVSSEKNITDVAHLACEIWREHYTPIIGPEQVDYMLQKFQSASAITEQLARGYEYFIITRNDNPAGYAAIVPEAEKMMLSKIYVKKAMRGTGLGQKMLELVENICRERGINSIWLTVNKNNLNSIEWYTRMGFINAGPTVQDIGNGFIMDDYRLEKTLTW